MNIYRTGAVELCYNLTMNKVEQSILINKSAPDVFAFSINPKNTPKWVTVVVEEETSEVPTRLGTIYKNKDTSGNWSEFEITAFEDGKMFELTKKDDAHHVRYIFNPLNSVQCELEYCVWVEAGDVAERFSASNIQAILGNLKAVMEAE